MVTMAAQEMYRTAAAAMTGPPVLSIHSLPAPAAVQVRHPHRVAAAHQVAAAEAAAVAVVAVAVNFSPKVSRVLSISYTIAKAATAKKHCCCRFFK